MATTQGGSTVGGGGSIKTTQSHQECHICLEELRQDLTACACGHVFHYACIQQALQVSSQCPICRRFAAEAHLVSLYLELPGEPARSAVVTHAVPSNNSHVDKLSERVSALIERLKWQKKQFDTLSAETKRVRSQSEQLLVDKQTLLQRVAALEANKSVLVNKVAKYQMELSRQAEATRQMTVNQSIISYLDTCDSEAMEEEIQNPRELIIALKKACKFRHDQYQKVVKEKARLKAMLQNSHHHPPPPPQQPSDGGKGKLKSAFDTNKRHYAMEYAPPPHPLELKKRKTDSGQVAGAMPSSSSSLASSPADRAAFTPKSESAGFRANAYSDVSVRPVTAARQTFARSSYNPNQYGAYNMTPTSEPPVQASSHTVCRRGYDETGKLTNFFIPNSKDAKRGGGGGGSNKPSGAGLQHKSMVPSAQCMQGLPQSTQSKSGVGAATPSQQQQQRVAVGGDRREFPLTNWLRKD